MSGGRTQSVSATVLEIVLAEPGSTLADVRGELAARGYKPHVATVHNALSSWIERGRLIRQEQVTRAKCGTVFCYRPNPDHNEAPHGEEEADP